MRAAEEEQAGAVGGSDVGVQPEAGREGDVGAWGDTVRTETRGSSLRATEMSVPGGMMRFSFVYPTTSGIAARMAQGSCAAGGMAGSGGIRSVRVSSEAKFA